MRIVTFLACHGFAHRGRICVAWDESVNLTVAIFFFSDNGNVIDHPLRYKCVKLAIGLVAGDQL